MSAFRHPTAAESAVLPKRTVVRADIALSSGDRLLIYETGITTITFPHEGEPKAEFKIVSGKKELLFVALKELPELKSNPVFAEGLRPTWFARLCREDGRSMIVVASGSGATGEGQFFLVFVGRGGHYRSFELPVAIKGRVELSLKDPDMFRLWSIVDSERIGTVLSHYEIKVYKLDDSGFHHLATSKTRHRYDPGAFVNHPILLTEEHRR